MLTQIIEKPGTFAFKMVDISASVCVHAGGILINYDIVNNYINF